MKDIFEEEVEKRILTVCSKCHKKWRTCNCREWDYFYTGILIVSGIIFISFYILGIIRGTI